MVFSSSVFLFAFLPAFLVLYFACPGRAAKNTWLLAASIVFYAWGEPVYVLLMAASIAANWLFGLLVGPAGVRDPGSGGPGGAGCDGRKGDSASARTAGDYFAT